MFSLGFTSYRWRKAKKFDTITEATKHAKEMFKIFESGKSATEIKPWTVEKGIEHYIANAERRVADPDDNYGT